MKVLVQLIFAAYLAPAVDGTSSIGTALALDWTWIPDAVRRYKLCYACIVRLHVITVRRKPHTLMGQCCCNI